MLKLILAAALALSFSHSASAGTATLTDMETRWLTAASPVLAYSQRLKLPIDIIVQPKAGQNDVPLAMGFDNGRCKLVLSIRGNPDAEKILEKAPAAERTLLIEAMAAHEVGHCWRYVQGVWHALPAGFVETGEEQTENPNLLAEAKEMREMRREEGFSDLVALAWVKQRHPEKYTRVYTGRQARRGGVAAGAAAPSAPTRARLARDGNVFAGAATPFDAASATWVKGLLQDE